MRPEDRLRARCRLYLDEALPEPGFSTGIEHGRVHAGDEHTRMLEWQRMRAQGVKVGLADIFIWYCRQFFAIELKVKTRPSNAQVAFGQAIKANGFHWVVVHSVTALHDLLVLAGVPIRASMRVAAAGHDAALTLPLKPAKPPRARRATPDKAALRAVARARAAGVSI